MNEEAREEVREAVQRRKRLPAVAFLIGALVVGAVAAALYFFWPDRAETPTTPEEAVLTDDLGLPAPDARLVERQVEEALKAAPESPSPALGDAGSPLAPPETGQRAPNDPPPPLPQDAPAPQT